MKNCVCCLKAWESGETKTNDSRRHRSENIALPPTTQGFMEKREEYREREKKKLHLGTCLLQESFIYCTPDFPLKLIFFSSRSRE